MAYKAEYKHYARINTEGEKTIGGCQLYGSFNFWEETAPKDRRIIRNKVNDFFKRVRKKRRKNVNEVPDEFLYDESKDEAYSFIDTGLYNKISLKFKVVFSSQKNLPLEKMVNLDSINDFILGKGKN